MDYRETQYTFEIVKVAISVQQDVPLAGANLAVEQSMVLRTRCPCCRRLRKFLAALLYLLMGWLDIIAVKPITSAVTAKKWSAGIRGSRSSWAATTISRARGALRECALHPSPSPSTFGLPSREGNLILHVYSFCLWPLLLSLCKSSSCSKSPQRPAALLLTIKSSSEMNCTGTPKKVLATRFGHASAK